MATHSPLDEQREAYLTWLMRRVGETLAPDDPPTKEAWAAENGVARSTAAGWERQPAFQAEYHRRTLEEFTKPESQHRMLSTLMREAESTGDPNLVKEVLNRQDKIKPLKPIDQQVASLEDLTDGELLELIRKTASLRGLNVTVEGE